MHSLQPSDASPSEDLSGRRDEMQRKALELFATRGFAEVSIRQLATHLDVSPGSIYYYIESKEALLFELIEHLYETLLDNTLSAPREHLAAPTRLRQLLVAHLRLHDQFGLHFLVAERELRCLSTTHQHRIQTLRSAYEDHLEALLYQLAGMPSDATMKVLANGTISMLNLLPGWLGDDQRPDEFVGIAFGMITGAINMRMARPDTDMSLNWHGCTYVGGHFNPDK